MNGKQYSPLACLFCFYCLFGFNTWAYAESQKITLAYLETGLKDLNDANRHAALQLLSKELTRGSDLEFQVVALQSMPEMLEMFAAGKLNYIIINSYLYLTDRLKLQYYLNDELWAIQRAEDANEEYVLVVANDYNYKNINSLSGKSISVHKDYLLQKFYLNYLIQKQTGLPVDKFFKRIKETRTDSQAVLDVFFRTSDSCLVPQYVVNLVAELNPAVLQGIHIVHHSGADFIPAIVLVSKNNPMYIGNIVRKNLLTLSESTRGQEILNLFSIKSIRLSNAAALQNMIKIYDDYQSLAVKK
jgi:hypothetical protein